MDAVKILGSLLGGGAMTSRSGGDLLGNLLGGAQRGGSGGGVADIMGQALSGGGGSGAGLGDMLGAALGSGSRGGAGGLGDLLGSVLGGGRSGGSGGAMGGTVGGVAMAALMKFAASKMAGAGAASQAGGQSIDFSQLDTPDVNNQAELLIEAMINAAKADGRVDAQEERAILERLGDLDSDEVQFVQSKLREPVDAARFAARVPADLRREVYATSLLAVELDERSEALYLRDLAQGLRLDPASCNAIHRQMGAPEIFR